MDYAKAGDVVAAEVKRADPVGYAKAPSFKAAFECVNSDGVVWRDGYENVVVSGGRAFLINRVFASQTTSTAGAFLALHSATTTSDHAWSNISASQVSAYGNTVPLITFATSNATAQTASASYGFTATTQTVLGAAVLFYTTNTLSTNAATANVLEYSEGQFGTTRTVGNGDTLNVTLTLAMA